MPLVFVLVNLGIVAGYMFLAGVVVPRTNAQLRSTRWGGVVFFLTCGLTHLELAVHAAADQPITLADFESWHMLAVHVVQVIAVWFFVIGLYREFVVRKIERGDR